MCITTKSYNIILGAIISSNTARLLGFCDAFYQCTCSTGSTEVKKDVNEPKELRTVVYASILELI